MNDTRRSKRLSTVAAALFLTAAAYHPAEAAHTDSALLLQVDDSRVEMANREVRLEIDKNSGAILRLFYRGTNLIGEGRGYTQSNDENGFLSPTRTTLTIARNDSEVIDVGFAHQHEFIVDYECHYALKPGESGFYNYIVYGSKADNPGEHCLGQLNYALRLDAKLFTHFADGAGRGALPTPDVMKAGEMIMDATYRLADGTVYTKYNHAASMDEKHRVHGLTGARYGAWLIMPSHEHLNGVPFNTELTLHQTHKTPVLHRHVQAAHHGSGVAEFSTKDGPWQKWGGPWFFYFNQGGTMVEREQEARKLATKMTNGWPFQWIRDKRFARERGTLRGQLTDQRGNPMGHTRVVITRAAEGKKPVDFQQQWRGYRFFGWTDAKGRFELNKVWPDHYDLYAMQDDVAGRFTRYDIPVPANKVTDLGTLRWQTPSTGRRLWQVGTLDRSAAEFRHGDDYRHWGLWMKIAGQFPDGIITIDADRRDARDIPHILAAYVKKDGTPYQPVLRVEFTLPEAPKEKAASLLIALAGAGQRGDHPSVDLSLLLNGEPLADVIGTFTRCGAIHRSGIRGHCQEETVSFPASRLRAGKNRLEIRLKPHKRPRSTFSGAPYIGIMLDALRLWVE